MFRRPGVTRAQMAHECRVHVADQGRWHPSSPRWKITPAKAEGTCGVPPPRTRKPHFASRATPSAHAETHDWLVQVGQAASAEPAMRP